MKRVPLAVAASILAAAGLCPPAQALPQILPHSARVAAAPLLLPARYHRHRYYHRHNESSPATTNADAGTIKSGQWEFAAQLESAALPAPGSRSAAAGAASGGAMQSTYAICVAADNAVPSAFVAGCKLDAVHRDGGRVTWSMTCANRQNAVRSDGVAQYDGDTMNATMVSHLPGSKAGDKLTDVAQRITGHYLGPCPAAAPAAAAAMTPAANRTEPAAATAVIPPAANRTEPSAPAAATAGMTPAANRTEPSAPATGMTPAAKRTEPAAATAGMTPAANRTERSGFPAAQTEPTAAASAANAIERPPSAESETEATTASPPEQHVYDHQRYRRHRRHYAYRRRWHRGGYYFGGGSSSGFGPNPYSANGY